jgi:outer membrane protein OmpA-like peptidoglycan-associated protein
MKKIITFIILITFLNLLSQDVPEKEQQELLFYSPTDDNIGDYMDIIYDFAPSDEAFVALIRIIEPRINEKDWEGAVNILTSFKDYFPEREKYIDDIIEILTRKDELLEERNIGSGINSIASEISPIQTADENTLYFTSSNRLGFDNETDDIFYSNKVNDTWQPAKKLDAPFNTNKTEESPQGITTDGNTIILFGNYQETPGGGDLYYAQKTPFGWSEAIQFPLGINTEHFECDGKLTNDGKAFIFVSDRPGGIGEYAKFNVLRNGSFFGNTDIYVSVKDNEGNWGEPINLGSVVNSSGAERKPFLHPDGKTLYFSSNGHPGLGRLDLFVSKRLDPDDWTKWSKPINLGKEINSPDNERGVVLNTNGDLAYFASAERRLNFGSSDIYTIDVPEALRPEAVTSVFGKVTNLEGFPLEAEIIWEDLETGKELGKMKSDPLTGNYFIVLPNGVNYGIYANREGYFPLSKNIDTRKDKISKKTKDDIVLHSISDLVGDDLEMGGASDLLYDAFEIKRKKKISINNLFFDYNKSDLLTPSFPELDRVVYLLQNYPIHLVEIGGHTDAQGSEDYNKKLSERRADEVRKYLMKKGIDKDKVIIKGYGPSQPVADNETDEGRAKNRRVELVILKSGKEIEVEKK